MTHPRPFTPPETVHACDERMGLLKAEQTDILAQLGDPRRREGLADRECLVDAEVFAP